MGGPQTCLNVAHKLLTGAMTKVLVENNGLVNSIRNGEFDLHPGVTEERNFSGRCPLPSSVRSVHGAVVRALEEKGGYESGFLPWTVAH